MSVAAPAAGAPSPAAGSEPPGATVLPCQRGVWIEVELVGEDDLGIADQRYRLEREGEEPRAGKTDAAGVARIEGLQAGSWTLRFPDLDREAWAPAAGGGEPEGAARRAGPRHRVQPGECVHTLADRHGFFSPTIWALEENAALREQWRARGVLLPDDEVCIPEREERSEPVATGRRHRFRRRGVPVMVRIRVEEAGAPLSGVAYLLDVEGNATSEELGADGVAERFVAPGDGAGTLALETGERYTLDLGRLEPASTDAGVRARLVHLAYLLPQSQSEPALDAARALRAAVRLFQRHNGLHPTGQVDADTRDRLVQVHGA